MRIYSYQPYDTLRAVIFRARQLFLCCPVNCGLTYRLPSIKFVPPGNFGVSGVQPQINSINYLKNHGSLAAANRGVAEYELSE